MKRVSKRTMARVKNAGFKRSLARRAPLQGQVRKHKGRACVEVSQGLSRFYDPMSAVGEAMQDRMEMALKSGPVRTLKDMTPAERAKIFKEYEGRK